MYGGKEKVLMKTRRLGFLVGLLAALGFAMFLAAPAQADSITYALNTQFAVNGPIPGDFGTVMLTDVNDGTVDMVVALNTSLSSWANAHLGEVYFNINPDPADPSPADVTITPAPAGGISGPAKADGDGTFDIAANFGPVGPNPQSTQAFNVGVTGEFLTIADFAFLSYDLIGASPQGYYFFAAHVQNLGPTGADSAWVGSTAVVPLPGSVLLLGFGLLGLALLGRRQRP
jgi:hypothetical protein